MSAAALKVKAGRAVRRGDTNWVDPIRERGLITVYQEDDLWHFTFTNLERDSVEEDLIVFPGDATFTKVTQSSGRVFVLRLASSSERQFYWMQDVDAASDERNAREFSRLLADVEGEDVEMPAVSQPGPSASTSSTGPSAQLSTPANATTRAGQAPGAPQKITGAQLERLRQILSGYGGDQPAQEETPDFLLTDVIEAPAVLPLLSDPALRETLFPFLPPTVSQNEESLRRVIQSTEFKRSVASLDRALRTGALGPLVASLGLSPEAAFGVEPFLRAIQNQARQQGGSASEGHSGGSNDMQTD